jgi:hypothetical protein
MKENSIHYKSLESLIEAIVISLSLHRRWLNTLSYLENCGARKIAFCEHPTYVTENMLKHAAEEFRHAYYLKRQISKIPFVHSESWNLDTYNPSTLLGGLASLRYLDKLELSICHFLKKDYKLNGDFFKQAAYLLITYAIEIRADMLYSLYQKALIRHGSLVSVHSIIIEEDRHLAEVTSSLEKFPDHQSMKAQACSLENSLFQRFLSAIFLEI